MNQDDKPTVFDGIVVICGFLGIGVAAAGAFVMFGLMMTPRPVSDEALRALGREIGAGIAQGACLEQRGEWRHSSCKFSTDE